MHFEPTCYLSDFKCVYSSGRFMIFFELKSDHFGERLPKIPFDYQKDMLKGKGYEI